jgi:hypothetical protein
MVASFNSPLRRRLALGVLAGMAALLLPELASACPSCKAALASQDPSQGDIVSGYFWSILFMMSMPFTILGSFSGYMYLAVRRARAEQAKNDKPSDES